MHKIIVNCTINGLGGIAYFCNKIQPGSCRWRYFDQQQRKNYDGPKQFCL